MTSSRLALASLAALAACSEPYVHVIVEGSGIELTAAPNTVSVAVYGDGERTDFDYTARLEAGREGELPATDFVLTGELATARQLRVSVKTVTQLWMAETTLDPDTPETLHLLLTGGERLLENGVVIGQRPSDSSVLYGAGIATAWVDEQGVQARLERDPDFLIGRPQLVENDDDASGVRLAARPNPRNGFGPDLYAIGWLARTREPKLRVTSNDGDHPIVALAPGVVADELRLGAAFRNADFAVAVAVRVGAQIRLFTVDELGTPIANVTLGTGVDALSGVVVTIDGKIIVAWRSAQGSHLVQLDGDLAGGADILVDTVVPDDVLAIALSPDGGRLHTVQLRGGSKIASVGYFPSNLEATGVDQELGTTISGGDVTVSACVIAWPERRADASGGVDLRYVLLDVDGAPEKFSHLLNASQDNDHIRPTTVCASPTRSYATFIEQEAADNPIGRLLLRRLPSTSQ